MAKFIYRMQSVLNIKEKLEEQAKNEFAQARQRLDAELSKMEKLHERKRGYEEESVALREEVLDIQKIADNQYALDRMDEYIAAQQTEVVKAQRDLEYARDNLTKAMQESKIHNKLKEKAFEQFKKDLVAQESKEIDELTSFRYGQKEE